MARRRGAKAALGFRIHTGWATAVALSGDAKEPQPLDRRRLELADPEVPQSSAPWHAGLERPGEEAEREVARLSEAARRATTLAVQRWIAEVKGDGLSVGAAAFVVGSAGDPSRIGNPHVRAHAEEGRLYRLAVEEAAAACGALGVVLVEREVWSEASEILGVGAGELKRRVTALGASFGKPWRAEEKSACVAAWVALRSGG